MAFFRKGLILWAKGLWLLFFFNFFFFFFAFSFPPNILCGPRQNLIRKMYADCLTINARLWDQIVNRKHSVHIGRTIVEAVTVLTYSPVHPENKNQRPLYTTLEIILSITTYVMCLTCLSAVVMTLHSNVFRSSLETRHTFLAKGDINVFFCCSKILGHTGLFN